ncbi:hypothetical protein MKX03_034607 [Papaver bracteatum]|nr:hypothetical protein MKX03_034607 [Papaver bracteatum]
MASSSSLIISYLSAKKPPSTIPFLFPKTSPPTPTIRTSSNNFFRPPHPLSRSTSFLFKTPLIKHKNQDYPQICSSFDTPAHTQVSSVPLCFSLADFLDAIELNLESTDNDSSEEEEEEEEEDEEVEEENMMKRWTVRELEEGVELKINMPGLGKEDVKVTLEETTLFIKGSKAELVVVNGDNTTTDDDDENDMMNTIISFEMDLDFLKLDEIRAEMKNGILKISIPKANKEKLVVDVQVE